MALAGSIFISPNQQFLDENGDPYAGGKLYAFVAGTSTPLSLYSDSDLSVPTANPLILDAAGRAGAVYYAPTGYKLQLDDADDVTIWTRDNYSDPSAVQFANLGVNESAGSKDVTGTYSVLADDVLVTADTSGGNVTVNLLAASASTAANKTLVVKNNATGTVAVTPDGSDTIENIAAAFTIPAASSPTFPTIQLRPDGVSNWAIVASHGL